MIILQTRPIQVLCRADFWQASSSSPPFLHSCIASSDSCQAGCCRRKPLPVAECSFSTYSLLQRSSRKKLVSAGLSRIATIFFTDSVLDLDSVAALQVDRLTENTELDECRDHVDIEIFATTNGSVRFTAEGFAVSNGTSLLASKEEEEEQEEKEEALMPFAVMENTQACLQPVLNKKLLAEPLHVPYSSSLPFSDRDALSSALENEIHILEKEKLRRKKISEANKNKIPWNKGKKYNKGKHRKPEGATKKDIEVLDNDDEIIVREKQRRKRIAAANLGKVPWNKGRQHSEETRRRIKERTIEAMKNPKIREKLRVHASRLSNETKSKISAGLVLMWEAKRKLKQDQKNCEEEWKEYVADAARMGHDDEDEYDWSSYDTISRDLRKDWRSNHKRRRMKNPRRPMTSAHRIKISNAIKEKWTNLSYRSSVEAAIQARLEKQGTEHVKVKRRRRTKRGVFENENFHDTLVVRSKNLESDGRDDDLVPNADSMFGIGSEFLQSIRKVQPAYRNPLSNEMLENLKRIRAKRRSKETSQSRALERARTLMAEAQMAARALEAQAATDESALPRLQEAQKLLAEAAESFKAAGLEGDFFLETYEGERNS